MKMTISGCPIRNVLARVGDKWSLLVMLTLRGEGVVRFGQLQRSVEDISQKSLTQTLRTLEEDGFVLRTVYPACVTRWSACSAQLGRLCHGDDVHPV